MGNLYGKMWINGEKIWKKYGKIGKGSQKKTLVF